MCACRIVLRTVRLCLTVERHGTACLRFDARKQYVLRSMFDRTCMIGYMALYFFLVDMQRAAVDVYRAYSHAINSVGHRLCTVVKRRDFS